MRATEHAGPLKPSQRVAQPVRDVVLPHPHIGASGSAGRVKMPSVRKSLLGEAEGSDRTVGIVDPGPFHDVTRNYLRPCSRPTSAMGGAKTGRHMGAKDFVRIGRPVSARAAARGIDSTLEDDFIGLFAP